MSFFEVSIDCNCTEESHTVLKGWTFPLINLLGLIGPHDEIQSIEFWYKSIVKPSLAKVLHLIHMSLYSRMILHWIFCIQIHHIREGKCDANVVSHWVDHIYIFFLLLPWKSCGWTKTNQLISDEIFIIKRWPTQIKAEVSFLPQSLTLSQVIFHFLCAWQCSTAMLLWINIKWWLEEDRGCVQNGIQAHYLMNTAQYNLYCCFFFYK